MTRLAPDWPSHTMKGPQGPQVAPTGRSGGVGANQGPVGTSQGNSEAVRTPLGQYNVLVYFRTQFCFANISPPPKIAQNWFCIQNLHTDLSFQKNKLVKKSVYWFWGY